MWCELKESRLNGRKFRRQHSIEYYIIDFYCPEERIEVELDGAQHDEDEQKKYDEVRTKYLNDLGIKVLRFNNVDAIYNRDKVLKEIQKHF